MSWFYEFFSETTIHGLCHIAKEKPLVFRLLWFLVFLMGLSATGLWYYNTVTLYLSKPTSSEFSIVREDRMLLPKVMICATNRFNRTKVRQLNISDDLLTVFHHDFGPAMPTSLTPAFPDYETQLNQTAEYQDLKKRLGARDHHEILDHLATNCQDIVLECLSALEGLVPCCSQAATYWFYYGPCVVLPRYEVSTDAGLSGMIFLLKYPNSSELSPSPSGGITANHHVYILRGDSIIEYDFGGAVVRGKFTNIIIKKVLHTSVNKPPELECVDKVNYSDVSGDHDCRSAKFKTLLFVNDSGQPESMDCASKSIIRQKIGDPTVACDPWENYKYYRNIISTGAKRNTLVSKIMAECVKLCPPACSQQRHEPKYTEISDLSIDILQQLWKDPGKARSIMETRGALGFSGKAEMEVINQQFSMTPTSLVGNLGGSLGLFLGGSLASLVHIIIYIVEKITSGRNRKAQGEENTKSPEASP